MTNEEIKTMIKQAKESKLYMTRHAKISSLQRGLSTADIVDVIDNIKRIIRINIINGNECYKIEGMNTHRLAVTVQNEGLIVITAMNRNKKRKGRGKRDEKMCNV